MKERKRVPFFCETLCIYALLLMQYRYTQSYIVAVMPSAVQYSVYSRFCLLAARNSKMLCNV